MAKRVYKRTTEHSAAISAAKTGIPLSPDHCAALSAAKTGVPLSPEHRTAISKGHRNSEAVKTHNDAMIGGKDIVYHHYIYDHNDLKKYTMKMTRARHGRIHKLMEKAGIKVPHINNKSKEMNQ